MNPYVLGGGLGLIVILSLSLKAQVSKNGELREKLRTQVTETLECVDANMSNDEVIASLTQKLTDITAARAADQEARERALVERDRELAALRTRASELERERRDEAFNNPDCKDLTTLRVDQFCPATADQLRQRSGGPDSDEDGDQGGSG